MSSPKYQFNGAVTNIGHVGDGVNTDVAGNVTSSAKYQFNGPVSRIGHVGDTAHPTGDRSDRDN
jgi:hypothetical protein